MTDRPKPWLVAVPWESVISLNKALCHAQKMDPLTNDKGFQKVERLWAEAAGKSMSLRDALDVCREAYDLGPFLFNNGNTFAAVGRSLVEEMLNAIPPVEAQILRTTVGHYIAGLIDRRELTRVLRHLEPLLAKAGGSTPAPAPPAVSLPIGREQRV